MNNKSHRDSIFLEDAEILSHQSYAGEQYILRLQAPSCAAQALPGQFAHLTVDPQRPLRRPISIMRASASEGWIDLLYKAVGDGTKLLANRQVGERISTLGPIGQPFNITDKRPVFIGGGVGLPPMVFAAESIKDNDDFQPLVIFGSEVPFPFQTVTSAISLPGIATNVTAAMPLLEDWGIANRLASMQNFAGTHQGYVTDLVKCWLDGLDEKSRKEVGFYACGPHPMLEAVVNLAREYALPVQVSLEEFMACGIGGCAGCTVEVNTENGTYMQRVCVDGPVFDGYQVFS